MGRTVEKVQGEPAGGKSSLQKKGTLTKKERGGAVNGSSQFEHGEVRDLDIDLLVPNDWNP